MILNVILFYDLTFIILMILYVMFWLFICYSFKEFFVIKNIFFFCFSVKDYQSDDFWEEYSVCNWTLARRRSFKAVQESQVWQSDSSNFYEYITK